MTKKVFTWFLIGLSVALVGFVLPIGVMQALSDDDPSGAKPTPTTLPPIDSPPVVQQVLDDSQFGARPDSGEYPDSGANISEISDAAPLGVQSPSGSSILISEGFDTVVPSGWVVKNLSYPLGTTNWFQGNDHYFIANTGVITSYVAANFNNTSGKGDISNWLISPVMTLVNGDTIIFYTRTISESIYPDRLQVRLSAAISSTNVGLDETSVGDFTTLLLDINPTLQVGGYPETWTKYEIVISGLTSPVMGRLAFRYFVPNGGIGINSNYIGVDTFSVSRQEPPPLCTLSEGFDAMVPSGWITTNLSSPLGVIGWFQPTGVFSAHSGDATSYAGVNYNSTAGAGTISNWMISPVITLANSDTIIFYTRAAGGGFPDRLQVRMSAAGESVNVGSDATSIGDFTILLDDINPTLVIGGYPETWTEHRLSISGLTAPVTGRVAFRYYVTNGGPSGANSNYIGVDTFSVCHHGSYLPVIIR